MDVSIITPVFNEEDNILPFFREIEKVMANQERSFEMIAVDDGSIDTSFEKLRIEAEKRDYLKLIRLKHNHGQSIALQAGIDASDGSKVVTIDSDLQNDPADIPRLLDHLESIEKKVVSGSRTKRNDPLKKKVESSIASRMRLFLFENDITDYGCTLKAFEREAVESLELHQGMHRYIPVLLEKEEIELVETEVNHRERYSGESKYGFWRLPRGFLDMIDLWIEKYGIALQRRRTMKPVYSIEEVLE